MAVETNGKDEGRDESGLTPAQRTWLEHIRVCEAEGLTFKAYCQREGLPVGGLYSARRKLRGCAGIAAQPATSPPRFAAVRLAHRESDTSVDVLLPNGVQFRATLPDGDALARLVEGLGRLAR
jgi:hypothetical protein